MTGRQVKRKLIPTLSIGASAAYLADFEQFHTKPLHHVQESEVALLFIRVVAAENRSHRHDRALLVARLLLRFQRNDPVDNVGSLFLGSPAVRQPHQVNFRGTVGLFGIALLHSHRKNHVGHDFLGECFQLFKQNHTGHITHPIHSKLV